MQRTDYDINIEFIKNPDLQDTFKDAKVSFKSLQGKEKLIMC